MPRFRPNTNTGGSNFLGFLEGQIVDFIDRQSEFDWADVFIDVIFKIPNSQYPVTYSLKGTYDREDDGKIKSCSLLNRVYYLFDAIGFKGGPNTEGVWEDEAGNKIDNIETHLSSNFAKSTDSDKYPYGIFVYKEWNDKQGKAFKRVCPKVVLNTNDGMADLKSYVAFLKQKNLIKEYVEGSSSDNVSSASSSSALSF